MAHASDKGKEGLSSKKKMSQAMIGNGKDEVLVEEVKQKQGENGK